MVMRIMNEAKEPRELFGFGKLFEKKETSCSKSLKDYKYLEQVLLERYEKEGLEIEDKKKKSNVLRISTYEKNQQIKGL